MYGPALCGQITSDQTTICGRRFDDTRLPAGSRLGRRRGDAAHYRDAGAATVRHIAEAAASGNAAREGPPELPHLTVLGLGNACRLGGERMVRPKEALPMQPASSQQIEHLQQAKARVGGGVM
jgi:hypothetical protein